MSLAWRINAAVFPSFANRCFDTVSHSQIWWNRSACEHELADLLWVISKAQIPCFNNLAVFLQGFMLSRISCCFTYLFATTSKFDLSSASTV